MSHAYQQLVLNEESREYVVINIHRSPFRFNRLPFGVSSAPSIFQMVMESVLGGILGVVVYLDDFTVTALTDKEHGATLAVVMERLKASQPTPQGQMCLSSSFCDLSWSRHRLARGTPNPGEGAKPFRRHLRQTMWLNTLGFCLTTPNSCGISRPFSPHFTSC